MGEDEDGQNESGMGGTGGPFGGMNPADIAEIFAQFQGGGFGGGPFGGGGGGGGGFRFHTGGQHSDDF